MYPYPFGDGEFILDVHLDGNTIIIRIDRDSLAQGECEGKPITELILRGCRNAAEDFEKLTESQGDGVGYIISENGVTLVPDFASRIAIECEAVEENPSDYVMSDLEKKCVWLGADHIQLLNKYEDVGEKYLTMISRLETEINKEIDRYKRKVEFFSQTNPEKAQNLSKHIEAYQRILKLMSDTGNYKRLPE